MNKRIPSQIKQLLDRLANEFKIILKDNFVGFYVHGSLAMNCFNIEQSDVDFLIVVKKALDRQTKRKIINLLIKSTGEAPPKGFEMSIIKQSELDNFKYPTPFELHFSNAHIEKHKSDQNYICGNDEDPDLAAHLVITKERGICLLGKDINEVFPEIPVKYYLDSIIQDSKSSLRNISKSPNVKTCEVPNYAVLNSCRVLAFVKDQLITSKSEGGQWGINNLPKKYKFLIEQALSKYSSKPTKRVEVNLLKDFGKYVERILT